MANELDIKKEGVVSIVENHDLGDIIKPLIREIHLFDSYIAGTTHLNDKSVLGQIKVGDMLTLQREDNKFDTNAILILYEGRKLGYVPEKDNIIFARLMDAGKLLKAKITKIQNKGDYFKQINIGIYLIDV
jgi:hypothetical protein